MAMPRKWSQVKPRPHQQQCRSNRQQSCQLLRQCCFGIAAGVDRCGVVWQSLGFGIGTMWLCLKPSGICPVNQINRTNLDKSIVRHRGRDLTAGLPSTLSVFIRVDSIKVLGVTFSRKFSVSHFTARRSTRPTSRVARVLTVAVRPQYSPSTRLASWCVNVVFQAIVANEELYASPAWWGFASADDRNRLEGFLRSSATVPHQRPSPVCAPMLTTSSLPK